MARSTTTPYAPDEFVPEAPEAEEEASPDSAPDPMAVLEQEVASLKDQLLRRRAEFDNYRRRVERDRRTAADDAVISMLSDLLPSLDALDKALSAKGTAEEIQAGVEITLKDVSATLSGRGVRIEDPTGEKFDPLRHQALSYEPVPGAVDGTIVACYRKGYLLGERLIRPSLVQVAQQSPEESPPVIVPASN